MEVNRYVQLSEFRILCSTSTAARNAMELSMIAVEGFARRADLIGAYFFGLNMADKSRTEHREGALVGCVMLLVEVA